MRTFFVLLFLAFAAYGQQKDKVAIVNTVDDGSPPVPHSELSYLTKKLRGIAINALPQKSYDIMTEDYIIDISGSQDEAEKKCEEAGGCLAKFGREIKVHYIAQARIGRFGEDLTITTELYDTRSNKLIGSLEGEAKNVYGLMSVLDAKAPDMFKKMPNASKDLAAVSPSDGLEKKVDYELNNNLLGAQSTGIENGLGKEKPEGSNPFWKSKTFWSIAAASAGALFVCAGYLKDKAAVESHESYSSLPAGSEGRYGDEWKSVETERNYRNIFYVAGGISFTLGLGVWLWF